jgi:aspartyl-tRNA synthetase
VDYKTEQFGDYPFIQSTFQSGRKWLPLAEVNEKLEGQEVLVRARVHNVRGKGNNCFVVLRENFSTLQACAFKSENISKDMLKYMSGVPNESIIDLAGIVVKPEKAIESCTQQVELQITKFFVVNRAANRLPLQISDASRKVEHNEFDPNEEDEEPAKVEAKVETKVEAKVEVKVEEAKVEAAETKPEVTEVKGEGEVNAAEGEVKAEGAEGEKVEKKKKEKKPK